MKKLLLTILLVAVIGSASAAWGKTRSGIVTVEVDLSGQPAGKELKLWLPYPLSDQDQSITGVKVAGNYAESAVYAESANGNTILYARWGKDVKDRKLSFSFAAERKEIVRGELPGKEPAWDQTMYRQYLSPTRLGPTDGEVRELAEKITRGRKTVHEKAKAIYDWTCENMYRDPATKGCGTGDVCSLLHKPGGKCTDISSVFVALARAAGVPAREVFGIRLGKKETEEITTWQHCWAEFYLPGYGWMPVDPADLRKAMLVEKLELTDAKTKEYRDYFWGGIDPYRIRIAVGRDIILNPPQAGPPLNTFGYPYGEADGKPLDFYDPKSFTYRIGYREK